MVAKGIGALLGGLVTLGIAASVVRATRRLRLENRPLRRSLKISRRKMNRRRR